MGKRCQTKFYYAWKKGEKRVLEKDNILIGYIWFEKHFKKKEIFINSIQIIQNCQRKGIGNKILKWFINEAKNDDLEYIRGGGSDKKHSCKEIYPKKQISIHQ